MKQNYLQARNIIGFSLIAIGLLCTVYAFTYPIGFYKDTFMALLVGGLGGMGLGMLVANALSLKLRYIGLALLILPSIAYCFSSRMDWFSTLLSCIVLLALGFYIAGKLNKKQGA